MCLSFNQPMRELTNQSDYLVDKQLFENGCQSLSAVLVELLRATTLRFYTRNSIVGCWDVFTIECQVVNVYTFKKYPETLWARFSEQRQ